MKIKTISKRNIGRICRELASGDEHLKLVYERYGAPPVWDREPGFATLLLIILEQQVSLASAKACFRKLAARVGDVSPINLLNSTDAELKRDGFSRQKTSYARHLAEAILEKRIDLARLHNLADEDVKSELTKLKGIGTWTAECYLLMVLLRPDIMPRGDIALHAAYQKLTSAERRTSTDEFIALAEKWSPYRSVAARLLWHFYLSERGKK
jgi:DNA-3-methyladenine glycosylase II